MISRKQIPYIISMMLIVAASNFLVQYPIKFFNLDHLLTWAALTYPITFLVTDVANRFHGIKFAKNIIFVGFALGVLLSIFSSTIRIAIASGTAFLFAQLMDATIFNNLRENKLWYVPPLVSSLVASLLDTFLFFSIAFYGTDVPWISLGIGDFMVKFILALIMLIPFRFAIIKYI